MSDSVSAENHTPDMGVAYLQICQVHAARRAYRIGSRYLTWAESRARVQRLVALTLASLGDMPPNAQRPVVALLLANSPLLMEFFFAAAVGRFVVLPINYRLAQNEIVDILEASGSRVLVTSAEHAVKIDDFDWGSLAVEHVFWADDAQHPLRCPTSKLIDALERDGPAFVSPDLREGEVLEIFATSGTTGRVKMVPHTHAAVLTHAQATIAALDLSSSIEECWAHIGPMFHVGDIAFVWAGLLLGARHVFVDNVLQVAGVSALLATENVTITKIAPSLLRILVESQAVEGMRFPALRWILTGGAKPDPALYQLTRQVFGCDFIQGYGMTEATCHIAFKNETTELQHLGLKVLPGLEVAVLSANGQAVSAGEIGEIVMRGPTVMPGYFVADQTTLDRGSFTPDGYFRTGDLGRKCSAGRLHVVGRLKDMINVGGENVFCSEVEAVIRSLPEVRDCAAFAVPDRVLGEVVAVAIELVEVGVSSLMPDRVREHCRTRLAGFKVPQLVLIESALPRTASGKIQKHLLVNRVAGRNAAPRAVASAGIGLELEPVLVDMIRRHLAVDPNHPISLDSNLLDLGLDSLQVIELLVALEVHCGFAMPATLIYDHPTLRDVANYLRTSTAEMAAGMPPLSSRSIEAATEPLSESTATVPAPSGVSWILQGLGLLVRPTIVALASMPVIAIALESVDVLGGFAVAALAPLWVGLSLSILLGLHVVAIRLLDPSAQSFAIWSPAYCRWLVAQNLLRSLDDVAGLIRGTPAARVFFRLLGAQIGPGARLDSLMLTDLRWVRIGPNAVIARDAVIQPARFTDGWVVREPIQVGEGAGVGPGAQLIGETLVSDGAEVRVLGTSSQVQDRRLGEMPASTPSAGSLLPFAVASYVYLASIGAGLALISACSGYRIDDLPALLVRGLAQGLPLGVIVAVAMSLSIVMPAASVLATAIVTRVILQPLGRYSRHRAMSHAVYRAMIEVPFFSMWLRLTVMSHLSAWTYRVLGVRVGLRPMLAAPYVDDPAAVTIGDHAIVAGNVSIHSRDWRGGDGGPVTVGSYGIVANSCVLLGGGTVPDKTLLGDLSAMGPADSVPAGSIAVGAPPRVVGRSRLECTLSSSRHYVLMQLSLVTLQMVVSVLPAMLGLYGLVTITGFSFAIGGLPAILVSLPLALLVRRLAKVLGLIAFKWLFIGRARPGEYPLMGAVYIRWVLLEAVIMDAEKAVLGTLRGTGYLAWLWRCLGARVGRNACLLASSLGCEFDLKQVGDQVLLSPQSLVFGHSVEHHTLLFRASTIGSEVLVEANAIIEAGAKVADRMRVRANRAVHAARPSVEAMPPNSAQVIPNVPINALEQLARSKLSPAIYDYFASGSDTGRALRRNIDTLADIAICPRRLRDVSTISLSTSLLGRQLSSPILVAPSAMHRLLHSDGESAVARATAANNMGLVLSMLSTTPLEEVAKPFADGAGLPLLQLYCLRDRGVVHELMARAEVSGYQGFVVTVDSPATGGLTIDPREWMKFSQAMQLPHLPSVAHSTISPLIRFESMKDPALTFADLVALQKKTRLPIWLKGILSPGDAVLAASLGFRGIILSNHGGRRLDSEIAAVEVVSSVRRALDRAGFEVTLLVDGGIRHGNDAFKALALGADAVMVGRAPLWGLAVGGEHGVAQVLKRLNEELVLAMKLTGCSAIGELTPEMIYVRPGSFAVDSTTFWDAPR